MGDSIDPFDLGSKCRVISLSVLSSSHISNRASLVVKHLTSTEVSTDDNPPLCILHANAKVANKLLSIVEIAKRELKKEHAKIYQYTQLSSKVITMKEKVTVTQGQEPSVHTHAVPGDEDEDAFQTMELGSKIRAVPMLTVYLTTKSLRVLKTAFGQVWRPRESRI